MKDIVHDPEKRRFSRIIEGKECFLLYRVQRDGIYKVYYTFVPPELRGQSYAVDLVEAMVDFARENKVKLKPTCTFVASCFSRHEEWKDVLES